MWLAERVWEPGLPKVLHDNGVHYTLVDDSHFLMTGMSEDEMTGPFLTEEQGSVLTLLPIRKDLRYAIPFKDPGETLTLLRRFVTRFGYRALVMFDDGEKFGLWPETYDHVYRDGWLERFLTVLESNTDWISCSRISDYLDETPPHGRVYLPTASYYEMGEWTLPPEAQMGLSETLRIIHGEAEKDRAKRYIHGGFWRNFLTKYEESNNLHKKMLWVSGKVHEAVSELSSAGSRPSGRAQKMLDALWAGQCNCSYWHGVFGGLYLPHLRQAIYRELLNAENLADKALKTRLPRIEEEDFDKDGRKEVLVEAPEQNLYFSPHEGGSLFEWDLRSQGINMLNVLTRRPEAYHQQLVDYLKRAPESLAAGGVQTIHNRVQVKEPGLEKRLFTDWYRRTSLIDHFLHPDTRVDAFYRCQYGEQGDFVKGPYSVEIVRGASPQLKLIRVGSVWTGEQRNGIRVEKVISLIQPLGWQVNYRIQNVEGPRCDIWFGSELNFAFSTQENQLALDHGPQSQWQRRDHGFGLVTQILLDNPADLWEFPLETVSLSEQGFERTYQGTVLLFHRHLNLEPGQMDAVSWRVEVTPE
jgi:hypothetical protein